MGGDATGKVITWFVSGSRRATSAAALPVIHTAPAPVVRFQGLNASWSGTPASWFVAGSIRPTTPALLSSTHTAPAPTASRSGCSGSGIVAIRRAGSLTKSAALAGRLVGFATGAAGVSGRPGSTGAGIVAGIGLQAVRHNRIARCSPASRHRRSGMGM